MRRTLVTLAVLMSTARAHAESRVHAELDPLPFARSGYGGQIGVRPAALGGLRLAVASFSLDVPDFAIQLGGNDRFHARVRPSVALYALYYLSAGRNGWAFGGSLRYLRIRYTHDDTPDAQADVRELSPEVIAAYKWHPTRHGFYVQPWLGLSVTLHRSGDLDVGSATYDPLPIGPFFTVNLGWELAL